LHLFSHKMRSFVRFLCRKALKTCRIRSLRKGYVLYFQQVLSFVPPRFRITPLFPVTSQLRSDNLRIAYFIFNDILASIVIFFIFPNPTLPFSPRPVRFASRRQASHAASPTICPQHDHHDRLSRLLLLVKRKMRADGQVGRWAGRQMGRW
jgi:hypothetical protein